jgi:hypothetical protein
MLMITLTLGLSELALCMLPLPKMGSFLVLNGSEFRNVKVTILGGIKNHQTVFIFCYLA